LCMSDLAMMHKSRCIPGEIRVQGVTPGISSQEPSLLITRIQHGEP
jgi:hypothetical protein